jgi:HlyD family secretion protein
LRSLIIIILFSLFYAGIILVQCSGESGSSENRSNAILPAVEAVQARHGALPLIQRLSGIVKAENQVTIYPEVSAIIVEVYVKNGDVVKKGSPLIRLRDKEMQEQLKQAKAGYQIALAQLKQAEALLNEVQAELKRSEKLAEQKMISPAELVTVQTRTVSAEATVALAKARVEQAKATVEERNETLSQTVIRAPITGSVGDRNAEVGMLVTNSTRLFTLGQLENVRIEVVLTDLMLNYIEEGHRAEIYGQHNIGEPMIAQVSRISPFLNPVTHSTEAEIDLKNPGGELKSGMFVTVDIYYGESEQATLVPLSALFENPLTGLTGVYISKETLNREAVMQVGSNEPVSLTDPVSFEFVPVEVIAKGRMEAGIRGVDEGVWVITLGQNLLGGYPGEARVRPVQWKWVERLQYLQREDLMEEVIKQQQAVRSDTTADKHRSTIIE